MVGENMEFLLGLLTAAVLFLLLFLAYRMGTKQAKTKPPDIPVTEAPKPSEEEIEKAKKIHEDFQRLMQYDVSKALERKQVE